MAASKLQMNWTSVGFTPTGGSLAAITKVTEVQVDPGGSLKVFSGDTDKIPTTIVQGDTNPKVTITTGDIAAAQALAIGTTGALAATMKDAKLATGGDIIYAIANAVVENTAGGGAHQEFGEASISFLCFSSDGTTHPIGFTRA